MKKWFNLENFTPTPKAFRNKLRHVSDLVKNKRNFWCEGLICATIFLLPIYLVKVKVFGLPTNILEILIGIVFVWFILKGTFRNFLKLSFRIAVGLIFIGLLASTLVNKNYAVSFGILKGWFLLPFLFALVVKNVISAEKRENIYKALYLSAVFVSILSLAYYFLGIITFDGRLQGIFNSPNYLAMYLAPAIIAGAISSKNKATSKKEKIFYIFSFLLILSVFYLTYSYAAWTAVIITLVILWLIKKDRQIKFKSIALAAALLLIIILAQWNTQKFADFKNFSERSSVSSRIMIWQATGKIIKDNWLWGIGPGNFQNKYLEYQKYFPPYLEWAVPHPHNLFLSFWLQAGLAGIIGFISLIVIWVRTVLIKKEKDIIWLISLGVMLYFILHGLADTTYFKNDLAVIFWVNFFLVL